MHHPFRYTALLMLIVFVVVFIITTVFEIISEIYNISLINRLGLELIGALFIAAFVGWLVIGTSPIVREILAAMRLMTRLESLSHPLLIRLSQEAPGTYHHSLQVGALAHRAARAIGADAILARLGGYYHDIGKLAKPEYFIENQNQTENPLNQLTPRQAARAIIAHIDNGLIFGTKYKLPDELLALIAQHTGTTTVHYFLEKAKIGDKKFSKDDFKYPGPKPQTREAGILMLADTIEAKARLIREPTKTAFENLVKETIYDKESENQLELSGLTKHDLKVLQTSFTEALLTMLHQRITYPARERAFDESAL